VVLTALDGSAHADIEAIRELLRTYPHAKVLVLDGVNDTLSTIETIAIGASGYLRRDAPRHQDAATITQAITNPDAAPSDQDNPTLSEQELQVLHGISQSKTNNQISGELYLSEDTIKTHVRRILRKLGATDRAQAVAQGSLNHTHTRSRFLHAGSLSARDGVIRYADVNPDYAQHPEPGDVPSVPVRS